jgi:hypothetical protein
MDGWIDFVMLSIAIQYGFEWNDDDELEMYTVELMS